jgi:RNA polymerase-binding transcription factor DksA
MSESLETGDVRALLNAELDGTTARIAALQRDWNGIVDASALVAVDDEHDPEGATIGFERAQVDALLASARARRDDLERALERLEAGSYGICERCGSPIGAERLAARPDASLCIACAAARSR